MTRILQTDLARDALYTKVNQIADEKVSLEGDETITGAKTFTSNFVRANTNLTKGTNPSSKTYCTVEFTDKNGGGTKNRVGVVESAINTNGDIETLIGAYKYDNNSTTVEKISVIYPKTGNPYTFAPRPTDTTTSSGTQIATTGWVNSGSNNVVHKSADETIAGTKTFTETTSGANLVQSTSATATGSYVDFVQQINGSRRGTIRTTYNSDGSYQIILGCNGPDAASPTGVIVKRTSTTTTATAPTPATSDNSTQIATTAFVKAQGYATSASLTNDYVNLTGEQTISGAKTFSKEINIKKSGPNVNLKNTGVTKGTNPSEEKQSTIYFDDNDGSTMGMIRHHVNSSGDTWMSLRSYPNVANQTTQDAGVYIRRYNDGTRFFYPTTASIVSLGKSDVRWKQIYCDTSTISTSDERLKQNIEELPDEVFEAWGEVEFYRFKFKSSVSEKGLENARYHTGVVAQRIKSIFEKHNLNASDYGLFCYDEWDYEPEERDGKGDIISPERPAGNEYSIRYEECLCMEAAYQRWRADKIEERLRRLEERL